MPWWLMAWYRKEPIYQQQWYFDLVILKKSGFNTWNFADDIVKYILLKD